MKNNRPKTGKALLFALVLFLPRLSFAHGLGIFVSTPVSPPKGLYLLILPGFIITTVGAGYLLIKFKFKKNLILPFACLNPIIFSVVFLGWGAMASEMSTAPPPGLKVGYPILWGLDWKSVGDLFLEWNLKGILLFIGFYVLAGCVGKLKRLSHWVYLVSVPALLYVLWLSPYMVTGAYSHGWAGGYVWDRCGEPFPIAIQYYTLRHKGRLPEATTMEALAEELVEKEIFLEDVSDEIYCPVASCFERSPKPYFWNGKWAGCKMNEVPSDVVIFCCPHHPDFEQSQLKGRGPPLNRDG